MTHIRHYVLTLGKKNPSPAGDGWYCAIMQRALRPRNSPLIG